MNKKPKKSLKSLSKPSKTQPKLKIPLARPLSTKNCDSIDYSIRTKVGDLEKTLKGQEKIIKTLVNQLNKPNNDPETNYLKKHYENNKMNENSDYEKDMLRKKIMEYEAVIKEKDLIIEEKDKFYKGQMTNLNEKLIDFQNTLGRLSECESELDELTKKYEIKEKELKNLKGFYEDKIEKQKRIQNDQKKEWTEIYNELFSELKYLKLDIDNINKRKTFTERSSLLSRENKENI